MPEINIVAVAVTTLIAFVLSATYYAVLGDRLATVSEAAASGTQMPAWAAAVELLRSLVVVIVVAGLAVESRAVSWSDGLLLGLALWVGFPMVLWTGAMLHEHAPFKLAAIHAGDWLFKLVVVATIITLWR